MARWMIGPGIGVLVAGMITIGLALYFFGGLFVAGGNFDLLLIGSLISIAGLVLLGLGGALRFVAALLLGVGILGIALDLGSGASYQSSPVGYVMAFGLWWGVPSLALGLIVLVVWWQSRRPSTSPSPTA